MGKINGYGLNPILNFQVFNTAKRLSVVRNNRQSQSLCGNPQIITTYAITLPFQQTADASVCFSNFYEQWLSWQLFSQVINIVQSSLIFTAFKKHDYMLFLIRHQFYAFFGDIS